MKLSQVLWRQHMGRMIKRHWFAHGQQVLGDTKTESILLQKGIIIKDAKELFLPTTSLPSFEEEPPTEPSIFPAPVEKDEKYPDYNQIPCLRYNNYDLLVQGTDQAQLLTKTLIVSDSLPIEIENLVEDTNKEVNNLLTRIIYTSTILDAHQDLLPKKKDPARPAWVFPRIYGISDVRKSRNLTQKMIQLCESLCGPKIVQQRKLIYDKPMQLSLEWDGDLLLFDSTIDMMLMSSRGLTPIGNSIDLSHLSFPNLYPLRPTLGLHTDHFYQAVESYPVSNESPWLNLHTLFIYHDCDNVKNFTELPVTKDQLLSRSLMKSFVAAACYAKQKFGNNVQDLPEPVTIQCVQTNSQAFHFSVFQLNTLNVDGTSEKCNLWWSMPEINLFEQAEYVLSQPTVLEYNPEVFKRILAFYKNT